MIERTHPLEQVPAALRYVEQGHSQGKHIIVVRTDAGRPSQPASSPGCDRGDIAPH